ncbi:MAG: LysR family transcriptional regulator [Pleurocapsa sp. MO_226.B13]|nr:LysR family transcriptional regulator [Pleurocapsa sp. MO_226.B13]
MLNGFDRLAELVAFVKSVEFNSFSAAARSLSTTPSAISKRVAKLEDRLGVRLLQRTTRSLSLTNEGTAYYERVSRLLRELEEANDTVISGGKPQGKLTISTSLDFGQSLLVQSLPEFLQQYPDIEIDLRLSDRFVDLVVEGIDVAIRLGDLEDSSLIRRHLGRANFALCASPSYLQVHGTPKTPRDLVHHNCLRYLYNGQPIPWEFSLGETWQKIPVEGTFNSDNGGALKNAALAGLGITRLLSFQVHEEVKQNRLKLLFSEQLPSGLVVQAVFTHQRNLSSRVQVFLNFLTAYCAKILV